MKDSPEARSAGGTSPSPKAEMQGGEELARAEDARGSVGETKADAVETVARALWEDWRKGKTAKQIHRDTSWEELLEGAKTRPLIQHIVDDGHSQARAAIAAYLLSAPKSASRDDVLEEAAKALEAVADEMDEDDNPDYAASQRMAARTVRALKEKPHG